LFRSLFWIIPWSFKKIALVGLHGLRPPLPRRSYLFCRAFDEALPGRGVHSYVPDSCYQTLGMGGGICSSVGVGGYARCLGTWRASEGQGGPRPRGIWLGRTISLRTKEACP